MVWALGSRVVVEGDSPLGEESHDFFVVSVGKILRFNAPPYGFHFDGGSVFIRAAHEDDFVSSHSMIAGNDVS